MTKIRPTIEMMTNRKSHTRFRLVSKSTTLDDLEGLLAYTLFQNASFGARHENLNEDVAQMPNDFWQCKVYGDIRGGSLETRRQTTML